LNVHLYTMALEGRGIIYEVRGPLRSGRRWRELGQAGLLSAKAGQ